jgi:Lipocalin-like domain
MRMKAPTIRNHSTIRPESARVSDLHGGWIRLRAVDEAGPSRVSFIGLASWNAARVPSGWEWLHRYIGYCGTYEVDEEKATVTHTPSVSLLPNLIDGRQCRSIDLQGDRLVLRAASAPVAGGVYVTSRLEWKRIVTSVAPSTNDHGR